MLGKKTGVLFTISSVNFELKQGKEYCSFSEFSIWAWPERLSLSLARARSLSLSLAEPFK